MGRCWIDRTQKFPYYEQDLLATTKAAERLERDVTKGDYLFPKFPVRTLLIFSNKFHGNSETCFYNPIL